MGNGLNIDEMRERANANKPASDGNGVAFAVVVLAVVAFVGVGTFFFLSTSSDGQAVAAPTAMAKNQAVKSQYVYTNEQTGKEQHKIFDQMEIACAKKVEKQSKNSFFSHIGSGKRYSKRKAREASKQMARMIEGQLGGRDYKQELMFVCHSKVAHQHACDPVYRGQLLDRIRTYTTSGSGQAMLYRVSGAGILPDEVRKVKRRKRLEDGMAALKTLLIKGYLQRSDFTSSFTGEPKWMSQLIGDRELPKRPCNRGA